jgi:lysyl endopeptidase
MLKTLKISLLLYFASVNIIKAQLESEKGSISDFKIDSWYEIKIDSQVLNSLSRLNQSKDVSYQFAVPVPVNLNPENSGHIFNNNNEDVWVLGIRSKEAKSLNLILDPFKIPVGAYVFIYDSSKRTVRGAFTDENNSPSGILPTMPVPGEELILEYHVPSGVKWEHTIGVSRVSHDFLGILGTDDEKDNRYRLSQACNIDINCSEGQPYSLEKQSVCRLLIGGYELCTGVLVNNTNQQNRPLLLTAQHCIADQNDADRTIFVFGYESPWCNGPDGRISHSLSGSVLRSKNTEIDFSLVELNTFPPLVYKPYLAGWDVTGSVPSHTVAIHHPEGDVKKLAVDLDPPVSDSFSGAPASSAWKILQWNEGTTEGGSSGSPLFDQNNRIVGILIGGEAVCGRSVNDYFAKLSVCYNYSSILWEQVKGWIDPAVSGVKQLNGRDPYASNLLTTDTLSNIGPGETLTLTKYLITGQGYATGFNSDSLVMYAEYIYNPAGHQISEVWLNIGKANSISSNDSIRVFAFADGSSPGTVLASQKVFIWEAKDSFRLKLDFKNTVSVSGNFYIGWRISYVNKALSEVRQFAIYHSPDRVDPQKNTAWFNDGSGWKQFIQHPSVPMSVSLDVKVLTTATSVVNYIPETETIANDFRIYPNPAFCRIVIISKKIAHDINFRIADITSNVLQTRKIADKFPGEVTIDISAIKPGFYLINLFSEGFSETHKILIAR